MLLGCRLIEYRVYLVHHFLLLGLAVAKPLFKLCIARLRERDMVLPIASVDIHNYIPGTYISYVTDFYQSF